jgi:hypothetical protein
MKQEEIEVLEGAIMSGIERVFEKLLADSPDWRKKMRGVDTDIVARAVAGGFDTALDKILLNPFPRRGQPRAVMNNARPLIRNVVEQELVKLL